MNNFGIYDGLGVTHNETASQLVAAEVKRKKITLNVYISSYICTKYTI